MFNLPEPQEYYENMYQAILDDTYATITGGMDGSPLLTEIVIK